MSIIEPLPKQSKILNSLLTRADLKQHIYSSTHHAFQMIRQELHFVNQWIQDNIAQQSIKVGTYCNDHGEFETELKFAGDTLFFIMHTNVFNFPPEHFVYKTDYTKEDPNRAYCGMILIYNFLADSVKYNRVNDVGYLLGRIFINKDGHYFMQGKRQYSFLHHDFSSLVFSPAAARSIVEIAITQANEFELFAPPIETIQEITLMDKIQSTGVIALKTGKRMGFDVDLHDPENALKMLLE